MRSKKEVINNLEKVLRELKKKEEKPKAIDELLKEISDKLSKLLEKKELDELEELTPWKELTPFKEYRPYIDEPYKIIPNTSPRRWWESPIVCKVYDYNIF